MRVLTVRALTLTALTSTLVTWLRCVCQASSLHGYYFSPLSTVLYGRKSLCTTHT